jgi:predicted ATP-binding protein involved in virulence
LVLIDEPEAHLHPPLLSSFMRSLSDLLIDTNAISIIATHSPVVLQEVPRSCVWKLHRSGTEARVERLEIESFGENAGVLTQEVFGLEVTDSGFHSILKKAVENNNTYEAAVRYLNNSIGLEGRAILRSLFYQKNAGDEEN